MLILRREEGQWIEITHRSGDVIRIRCYNIRSRHPGELDLAFDDRPRNFLIHRTERNAKGRPSQAIPDKTSDPLANHVASLNPERWQKAAPYDHAKDYKDHSPLADVESRGLAPYIRQYPPSLPPEGPNLPDRPGRNKFDLYTFLCERPPAAAYIKPFEYDEEMSPSECQALRDQPPANAEAHAETSLSVTYDQAEAGGHAYTVVVQPEAEKTSKEGAEARELEEMGQFFG